MTKNKWLIVITELAGVTAYTGGIGTRYAATLPQLVNSTTNEYTVLLLTSEKDIHLSDVDVPYNLRVNTTLRRIPSPFHSVARPVVVRLAARKIEFDAVYSPEWQGSAALMPRRTRIVTNLATGLRLASEIEGLEWTRWVRLTSFWRCAPQRAMERIQILRSMRIIPCSSAILRRNESYFGNRLPPATIMRNCVDVDRIRELVSSRTQKTNDAPIVLFVGRLEVRKGIDIAIRSFRDILRSHPKAQLHLAGSFGSEHNEARFEEAMATLSVKERSAIRLLGHLGANDTIEAMASADIVIAPSRWEAFGNVALEAKAAGTPLVATSGSGFADYCISGYDSVLVKPGNHEELTNAVVKLIDDKHLCKALANNASRSIDKFSASSVAADLDQILAGSLQHVEKVKR